MGLKKISTIGIEQANKGTHTAAIAYNIKKYLRFIIQTVMTGASAKQTIKKEVYQALKAHIGPVRTVLNDFYFHLELLKQRSKIMMSLRKEVFLIDRS